MKRMNKTVYSQSLSLWLPLLQLGLFGSPCQVPECSGDSLSTACSGSGRNPASWSVRPPQHNAWAENTEGENGRGSETGRQTRGFSSQPPLPAATVGACVAVVGSFVGQAGDAASVWGSEPRPASASSGLVGPRGGGKAGIWGFGGFDFWFGSGSWDSGAGDEAGIGVGGGVVSVALGWVLAGSACCEDGIFGVGAGVAVELSCSGVGVEWMWGVGLLFCCSLVFFSWFVIFFCSVTWATGFSVEFFLASVLAADWSWLLLKLFLL